MSKAQLVEQVHQVAEGTLTKKKSEEIVNAVFDAITSSLNTAQRFSYPKFGTLSVKDRAERQGRNPQTGEIIKINAHKTVTFKPSPALKDTLQG